VEHVVTFFCDEGEKYLNDYFTTPWGCAQPHPGRCV